MARILMLTILLFVMASQMTYGADKWEYGELSSSPARGKNASSPLLWITGEQIVKGDDWKGLEEGLADPQEKNDKATAVPVEKNPSPDAMALRMHQQRALNQLGRKGWELVSAIRTESGLSKWIFKRKIDETSK